MPKENNLLKSHPFDLVNRKIEISIEEYARHVQAFSSDEELNFNQGNRNIGKSKFISFETVLDELQYERDKISRDLEYLTSVGFLEKALTENGSAHYALTEEADEYLEEFLGFNSEYKESVSNGMS